MIEIIEVMYIDSYLDGGQPPSGPQVGTLKYIDKKGTYYYKDRRWGTSTYNSIFDRYPGNDGAGILMLYLDVVEEFTTEEF